MADYKEFLAGINRAAYHEGEEQWQEGEYTVTRTHHWSGPGCHNSCGVLLYTRNGKLEKVEGDPLNPWVNGRLCIRCLNNPEAVNHPDRLKWPLKRVGERGENKWERITWDEAYNIIEEKVKYITEKYGAETIIGITGTGRNVSWQIPFLTYAGFNSPNHTGCFLAGYSCYLPRVVGNHLTTGDYMIVDASQGHEDRYANPEWRPPAVLVIWGNEPLKSNADGYMGHWLVQCMQMGTKVICVDPQLTWWAARAEYWLPLRPGTDAAMAMAWLNVIITEDLYNHEFVEKWTVGFDELAERVKDFTPEKAAEICGVPAEKIRGAARLYASLRPGAIQWGLALEQQTSALPANLAINHIWTLMGDVDCPGGMLIVRNAFNTHRHYNCGQEFLTEGQLEKRINFKAENMKGDHMVSTASTDGIFRAIITGEPYKPRMFWINSSNFLACGGNEAPRLYEVFKKEVEFVVATDLFMTPTIVALADLVLPCAMSCERDQVRTWWTPLRTAKKVTQYYECKTDEDIVVEVGKRLRPENFPWKDGKEFIEWYITKDGDYPGTLEDLYKQGGYTYWEFDSTYYKYEKSMLREDGEPGFNTTTGKIELAPTMLAVNEYDPLPFYEEPPESPVSTPELAEEYPLIVVSGARSWEFFHSEQRQQPTMRYLHPEPLVKIHPDTAKKYGIKDGDWIWIEGPRGRFMQKAKYFVGIRRDVISAEHGWWFPEKEGAEPSLYGAFDCNPMNLTQQMVVGVAGMGSPVKCQMCKIYKVQEGDITPTQQVIEMGGFKYDKLY